jgi:hypothetical protein
MEQLSQHGVALSDQDLLTSAIANGTASLNGGIGLLERPRAGQLNQATFSPELEPPQKTTLSSEFNAVRSSNRKPIGFDTSDWNDYSRIQFDTCACKLNNSENGFDKAKRTNAIQGTETIDPLIGIPKGVAIVDVTEDDMINPNSFVNGKSALDSAVTLAQEQMNSFISDDEFVDKMYLAFGDNWHSQTATALLRDLVSGEAMPTIEIVSTTGLLNANGAFGEGTIYLSEEFLSKNAGNSEAIANVLLEEIGHYLDQELNQVDSPGDEGDIFARLVQDETISDAELAELEAEDDNATITLNGETISIELAAPPWPGKYFKYEPGMSLQYDPHVEQWQQRMQDRGWRIDVDGLYGPQSKEVCIAFQQEKGLAVDGIVGPDTWNTAFRTDNVTDPIPAPPNPPQPGGTDYSQLVDRPSPSSVNQGLTSPNASFMTSTLGTPGALTTDCSSVTNPNLERLLVTEDVGPFRVTGLKPAVDSIRNIFATVRQDNPTLYSQLGTAGMLCVRKIRGGSSFSNHSWGTAIDIKINGQLDALGDGKTQIGLKELYPYFHREGFYWGGGYSTREDSMHFEASEELVNQWKTQGVI